MLDRVNPGVAGRSTKSRAWSQRTVAVDGQTTGALQNRTEARLTEGRVADSPAAGDGHSPDIGANRRRQGVPSRFQFCQLVEVGVVVRDVETVDPGARKDDQVRKRDGHA